MPRAVGQQGSWFATIKNASRYPDIDGRRLPCLWSTYWEAAGQSYNDTGFRAGERQWDQLVESLKNCGYAILRRPKKGTFEHEAYIAAWKITDVSIENGLRLKFVQRVCDLDN